MPKNFFCAPDCRDLCFCLSWQCLFVLIGERKICSNQNVSIDLLRAHIIGLFLICSNWVDFKVINVRNYMITLYNIPSCKGRIILFLISSEVLRPQNPQNETTFSDICRQTISTRKRNDFNSFNFWFQIN